MSAVKPSECSEAMLVSAVSQVLEGRGSPDELDAILGEIRARAERLRVPEPPTAEEVIARAVFEGSLGKREASKWDTFSKVVRHNFDCQGDFIAKRLREAGFSLERVS